MSISLMALSLLMACDRGASTIGPTGQSGDVIVPEEGQYAFTRSLVEPCPSAVHDGFGYIDSDSVGEIRVTHLDQQASRVALTSNGFNALYADIDAECSIVSSRMDCTLFEAAWDTDQSVVYDVQLEVDWVSDQAFAGEIVLRTYCDSEYAEAIYAEGCEASAVRALSPGCGTAAAVDAVFAE